MAQFVRIERSSNGVATIRIDRPPVNALSLEVVVELIEAAGQLSEDRDVRAVVIWGGPSVFSAGLDVEGFWEDDPESYEGLVSRAQEWIAPPGAGDSGVGDLPSLMDLARMLHNWTSVVARMPQITISAVNGAAVGAGLGLALATDFRVAADDAVLGEPAIRLGLVPGNGVTHRLPRFVGAARAKEMMLSGNPVDAVEALRLGLVSTTCAPAETYDTALEMAAGYAAGPAALQLIKEALEPSLEPPFDRVVTQEAEYFARSIATDDAAIGLGTFMNRDPETPPFTGR